MLLKALSTLSSSTSLSDVSWIKWSPSLHQIQSLLWTTAAFTNIWQFWTSLNLGNFSYSQQYYPTDFQFDTRGMRYEFLPPYSSDYNPIELAFSAMKYHLHWDGAYIHFAMTQLFDTAIFCTLHKALYQITSEDTFGWFRHCGYI